MEQEGPLPLPRQCAGRHDPEPVQSSSLPLNNFKLPILIHNCHFYHNSAGLLPWGFPPVYFVWISCFSICTASPTARNFFDLTVQTWPGKENYKVHHVLVHVSLLFSSCGCTFSSQHFVLIVDNEHVIIKGS